MKIYSLHPISLTWRFLQGGIGTQNQNKWTRIGSVWAAFSSTQTLLSCGNSAGAEILLYKKGFAPRHLLCQPINLLIRPSAAIPAKHFYVCMSALENVSYGFITATMSCVTGNTVKKHK